MTYPTHQTHPTRLTYLTHTTNSLGRLSFGTPQRLFGAATSGNINIAFSGPKPSPDGTRFLTLAASGPETDQRPIVVTVNWQALLR